MHLKTGLAAVAAALLSTAVWAPTAHAEGKDSVLWYVENHGDGYDLQVDYSATAQTIRNQDNEKYTLHFDDHQSDGDSCSYGDQGNANFRTQTIPTWTQADALNPATHTYCWFDPKGPGYPSSGATVASAKLTAVMDDGGRYAIAPSGTAGSSGIFNYKVANPGGLAGSWERTWVTDRVGDTGGCQVGSLCGVKAPTWQSASAPSSVMDVEWRPSNGNHDLVWKVRWRAPKLQMQEIADKLGSIKREDCTIIGTPGNDVLVGTDDDDVICGLGGDDTIDGRGGNDIIKGGSGNDTIDGGAGNDILGGGSGDDTIKGGAGDDLGHGGTGQDTLLGGTGTDHMAGNSGDDTMASQSGDPVVVVNVDGHNVHDSTDATVVEDSDGDGRSGGGDGTAWREMM